MVDMPFLPKTNNHRPQETKETTTICQLANGKAPDHLDMTAAHYKIERSTVSKYIAGILNKINKIHGNYTDTSS